MAITLSSQTLGSVSTRGGQGPVTAPFKGVNFISHISVILIDIWSYKNDLPSVDGLVRLFGRFLKPPLKKKKGC